jgi:RNA polymerase sigma factor (sigma-70 family)
VNLIEFPYPAEPRRRRSIAERNELMEQWLHLVPPIARAIAAGLPPCFTVDELISHGHMGLMRAADNWDPALGPFEQRARYLIEADMKEYTRRRHYTAATMLSLDEPLDGEDGGEGHMTRQEVCPGDDADDEIMQAAMKRDIARAMARLKPRHKIIIQALLDGKSTEWLKGELGIESSRVWQLKSQAFMILRNAPELRAYRKEATWIDTMLRRAA